MADRVRIIKYEAVPQCGNFEVRYPDGRPSQYFYCDDLPSRRLNPATLDCEIALEKAKAVARAAASDDNLDLCQHQRASGRPRAPQGLRQPGCRGGLVGCQRPG